MRESTIEYIAASLVFRTLIVAAAVVACLVGSKCVASTEAARKAELEAYTTCVEATEAPLECSRENEGRPR